MQTETQPTKGFRMEAATVKIEKPAPRKFTGGGHGHKEHNKAESRLPQYDDTGEVLPRQVKNSFFANPLNFREMFKLIMRRWSPALSPAELGVVMYVIDRTVMWGKEWERMTLAGICQGRAGKDGEFYTGAVTVSENTMSKILASLEQQGVIRRRRMRTGFWISLNYSWLPEEYHYDPSIAVYPVRRDTSAGILSLRQKREAAKETKAMEESKADPEVPSLIDNIMGNVLVGMKKSKEKKAAARDKQKLPTVPALKAAFAADTGGILSNKECYIIRNKLGAVITQGLSVEEHVSAIRYAWSNWGVMLAVPLSWVGDKPATPAVGLICHSINNIVDCYRDQAGTLERSKMSPSQRRIADLVRKGIDQRVAHRIVWDSKDKEKFIEHELEEYRKEMRAAAAQQKPQEETFKPSPDSKVIANNGVIDITMDHWDKWGFILPDGYSSYEEYNARMRELYPEDYKEESEDEYYEED